MPLAEFTMMLFSVIVRARSSKMDGVLAEAALAPEASEGVAAHDPAARGVGVDSAGVARKPGERDDVRPTLSVSCKVEHSRMPPSTQNVRSPLGLTLTNCSPPSMTRRR